jgi:hypothetical protein
MILSLFSILKNYKLFLRFDSILFITSSLIVVFQLLTISIRLSKVITITSKLEIAFTEAVLSSSFKRAISPNISPDHSFATIFHFIKTSTSQDSIIYHFQFDSSHSTIIVSQGENFSF